MAGEPTRRRKQHCPAHARIQMREHRSRTSTRSAAPVLQRHLAGRRLGEYPRSRDLANDRSTAAPALTQHRSRCLLHAYLPGALVRLRSDQADHVSRTASLAISVAEDRSYPSGRSIATITADPSSRRSSHGRFWCIASSTTSSACTSSYPDGRFKATYIRRSEITIHHGSASHCRSIQVTDSANPWTAIVKVTWLDAYGAAAQPRHSHRTDSCVCGWSPNVPSWSMA